MDGDDSAGADSGLLRGGTGGGGRGTSSGRRLKTTDDTEDDPERADGDAATSATRTTGRPRRGTEATSVGMESGGGEANCRSLWKPEAAHTNVGREAARSGQRWRRQLRDEEGRGRDKKKLREDEQASALG